MTNLESLANLGEIVGAIAVVVSLIYLAVQVRQNTQAQQTENFFSGVGSSRCNASDTQSEP